MRKLRLQELRQCSQAHRVRFTFMFIQFQSLYLKPSHKTACLPILSIIQSFLIWLQRGTESKKTMSIWKGRGPKTEGKDWWSVLASSATCSGLSSTELGKQKLMPQSLHRLPAWAPAWIKRKQRQGFSWAAWLRDFYLPLPRATHIMVIWFRKSFPSSFIAYLYRSVI